MKYSVRLKFSEKPDRDISCRSLLFAKRYADLVKASPEPGLIRIEIIAESENGEEILEYFLMAKAPE